MRARRLSLAALAAVGTVWGALPPARANARLETEEQRISRVLQSTLVAHGAEVNRCFEKALADTMEIGGKVELAVDVGAGGRVTKSAPALDEPSREPRADTLRATDDERPGAVFLLERRISHAGIPDLRILRGSSPPFSGRLVRLAIRQPSAVRTSSQRLAETRQTEKSLPFQR